MTSYVYDPLPPIARNGVTPPFTRLLYLEPSAAQDEPFRGHLEIVNLEQAPPYEALSYSWGTADATNDIWLDSAPLRISIKPNLESALRALRQGTVPRRLWIDALCINQADVQERNRQVGYMRLVYKHATRAIVWLGPKTPGVEEAFDYARQWVAGAGFIAAQRRAAGPDIAAVRQQAQQLLAADVLGIARLRELMMREYFSRCWCIQEVVASRSSIAKVDELEMPLLELIMPSVLGRLTTYDTMDTNLTMWLAILLRKQTGRNIFAYHVPSLDSTLDGSMGYLLALLRATRSFRATDPRDKIFSLLGICNEGLQPTVALTMEPLGDGSLSSSFYSFLRSNLPRFQQFLQRLGPRFAKIGIPQALSPDYGKGVVSIYTQLARLSIHMVPRRLDVLDQVQHNGEPGGGDYPSWVPKWFEPPSCVMLHGLKAGIGARHCHPVVHDNALPPRPARNAHILSLDGTHIDVVRTVSEVMAPASPAPESVITLIKSVWPQLFPDTPFPCANKHGDHLERLDITFCKAMCGGPNLFPQWLGSVPAVPRTYNVDPDTWAPGPDDPKVLEDETRLDVSICAFLERIGRRAEGETEPTLIAHDAQTDEARFLWSLGQHANNRRLFLTQGGHIGLGPKMTAPGDEVVVFFGGRLPYVVRREGDHHIFIGQCYIRDYAVIFGIVVLKTEAGLGSPIVTFHLK